MMMMVTYVMVILLVMLLHRIDNTQWIENLFTSHEDKAGPHLHSSAPASSLRYWISMLGLLQK
jgi:hypothetical protein